MGTARDAIRKSIFALQDPSFRDFQIRLLPTIAPELVIGVRTPALRQLAKKLEKREEAADFLRDLPHRYFEENQLHALVLSLGVEYAATLDAVNAFLPYVDNWATCDQLLPRAFRSHGDKLLPEAFRWMSSEHTYTVRYGVGVMMRHYLDERFDPSYLDRVAALRSEEYYVNMMIAWYFATALAKQYDAAVPILERHMLAPWTHNKAIQKALESFRVPEQNKQRLRALILKKS